MFAGSLWMSVATGGAGGPTLSLRRRLWCPHTLRRAGWGGSVSFREKDGEGSTRGDPTHALGPESGRTRAAWAMLGRRRDGVKEGGAARRAEPEAGAGDILGPLADSAVAAEKCPAAGPWGGGAAPSAPRLPGPGGRSAPV